MANRTLEWIIKLVDRFSGPAGKADSAVGRMTKQLDDARKAAGAANLSLEQTAKRMLAVHNAVAGARGSVLGKLATSVRAAVRKAGGAPSESIAAHIAKERREVGGELRKLFKGVAGTEGGNILSSVFGAATGQALGMATAIGAVVSSALVLKDVIEGVVHLFAEAVMKVGELTVRISRFAVETGAYRENTMVSLKTLLGSAGAAQSLFSRTVTLADRLPILTKQAVDIETGFVAMGIHNPNTLRNILVAASDVQALGKGSEGSASFVNYMKEIAAGGLQGRQLRYLGIYSGVSENLIAREFGKMVGKPQANIRDIMKMVDAGRFSTGAALTAVLRAVADSEHGRLGVLSGSLGRTFTGLMSTLRSRPFDIFADFDRSAGFGAIKGALGNLVQLTDPKGKFGKQLKASMETAFGGIMTSVFGGLSGAAGKEKIKRFLAGIPDAIKEIGDFISSVISNLEAFGGGFVSAAGPAIRSLIHALGGGNARGTQQLFRAVGFAFGVVIRTLTMFLEDAVLAAKGLFRIANVESRAIKALMAPATAPLTLGELLGDLAAGHGSHPPPSFAPGSGSTGAPATGLHLTQHIHFNGDVTDPDRAVRRLHDVSRAGFMSYLTSHALGATGKH